MDELDLIRCFRSDVPAPSAAATADAERAWRSTPRRRTPRLSMRVAAGAAALAAVAAAALLVPSDDRRLGAEAAQAAATLRHAAAEVRGLPRPLRAGEFWYVRTWTNGTNAVEGDAGAYTATSMEVREEWTAADGTRRWTTRPVGRVDFPTARDRERWQADGRPRLSVPASEDRSPGNLVIGLRTYGYRELLALPRDPRLLYERFRAAAVECRCGNGVDDQTFVIGVELLRGAPLPTDLRAAVLRAMARIPGIAQQPERDVLGRPGVGVAYEGSQGRQTLIFDPSTYRLLGERSGPGGSADVASGIVGSATDRP